MKDQELFNEYMQEASDFMNANNVAPGMEAVFMGGVQWGLEKREQELNK